MNVIDIPRDYNTLLATRKADCVAQSLDYVFGLKTEELVFRTPKRLAFLSWLVRCMLKTDFVTCEREVKMSGMPGLEKEMFCKD